LGVTVLTSGWLGVGKPGLVMAVVPALKYVAEDELRLLLKGTVPEARASLNDAVRVIATARVDRSSGSSCLA